MRREGVKRSPRGKGNKSENGMYHTQMSKEANLQGDIFLNERSSER